MEQFLQRLGRTVFAADYRQIIQVQMGNESPLSRAPLRRPDRFRWLCQALSAGQKCRTFHLEIAVLAAERQAGRQVTVRARRTDIQDLDRRRSRVELAV